MGQRGENTERERRPISFPQWKQVLAATALPPSEQLAQQRAIIAFLGFCKKSHAPASIILIQSYLKQLPEQERSAGREALRWFVLAAERLATEHGQRTTDNRRSRAEDGFAALASSATGGSRMPDGATPSKERSMDRGRTTEAAGEDETRTRSATTVGEGSKVGSHARPTTGGARATAPRRDGRSGED